MSKRTIRLISLLLVCLLAFTLVSCGGGDAGDGNGGSDGSSGGGGGNGSGGGDGSGGGGGSGGGDGGGEAAGLQITGNVENEMAWTEEEVHAMDTVTVQSTNRDGELSDYTGVPINTLLEMAGVADGATTISSVADDGYTAEVALSEVQACDDCIVSFRNRGGFSIVMPDFPGNLQVKGVIEIQVQ